MLTNRVSPAQFIRLTTGVADVWELMKQNIDIPLKLPAACYLDNFNSQGYAIGVAGELRSLWSLGKGFGERLVAEAVSRGAAWLTCFDNGYLVQFFIRCGFDEVGREKNWVDGGPDVVRMAWRQ